MCDECSQNNHKQVKSIDYIAINIKERNDEKRRKTMVIKRTEYEEQKARDDIRKNNFVITFKLQPM